MRWYTIKHIIVLVLDLVACITAISKTSFLSLNHSGFDIAPLVASLFFETTSAPTERCEWCMRRWIRYVRGGPDGEDGKGTDWPTVWWVDVSCHPNGTNHQNQGCKGCPPQCHPSTYRPYQGIIDHHDPLISEGLIFSLFSGGIPLGNQTKSCQLSPTGSEIRNCWVLLGWSGRRQF